MTSSGDGATVVSARQARGTTIATLEAIIPGTQIIPTLTLAWIGVRLFNITSDRSKTIDY